MKMPEWLEKERDEKAHDISRLDRTESVKVGFNLCFELMAAERDMLRAALKIYADRENDTKGGAARVVLAKSDRFGGGNNE